MLSCHSFAETGPVGESLAPMAGGFGDQNGPGVSCWEAPLASSSHLPTIASMNPEACGDPFILLVSLPD